MALELSPHDRGHVDRGLHNDQPSVLLGQIFAGVCLIRLLRLSDAADSRRELERPFTNVVTLLLREQSSAFDAPSASGQPWAHLSSGQLATARLPSIALAAACPPRLVRSMPITSISSTFGNFGAIVSQ